MSDPLLVRVDPALGSRLLALGCHLIWATTWMEEANECIAPLLGLPALPLLPGRTFPRTTMTPGSDCTGLEDRSHR